MRDRARWIVNIIQIIIQK